MRQVHGEHPCDGCDKSFERDNMLRTHRETMHKEDNIIHRLQKSIQQGEVPDGST